MNTAGCPEIGRTRGNRRSALGHLSQARKYSLPLKFVQLFHFSGNSTDWEKSAGWGDKEVPKEGIEFQGFFP